MAGWGGGEDRSFTPLQLYDRPEAGWIKEPLWTVLQKSLCNQNEVYSNQEKEAVNKRNLLDRNSRRRYDFLRIDFLEGNFESAYHQAEELLEEELDKDFMWVRDLIVTYGYTILNTGRAKEAYKLDRYEEYLLHYGDYHFIRGLLYMENGKFQIAVQSFLKATECLSCTKEGVNDYLAFYNAGIIMECLGEREKAREYYACCGEYSLAKKRLAELMLYP